MTQPFKQNERVLDYIYGELDAGERTSFEAELEGDVELRAEVESLSRVRGEITRLPKLTQSPDSVSRMTALLMQQAAQAAGADKKPSEAAPADADGAKIIPLRSRSLRRIFTSPASGIFAAAAAALFWVVLKSQTPIPQPTGSTQKLEPVSGAAPMAKEAAVTEAPPILPAPPVAPGPAAAQVQLKEAFGEALKADEKPSDKAHEAQGGLFANAAPSTAGTTNLAKRGSVDTGKFKGKDDFDNLLDGSYEGKKLAVAKADRDAKLAKELEVAEKRVDKKPMVVAMAPHAEKKSADSFDERFAQPPPAPSRTMAADDSAGAKGKTTVRQQMAQAGDRRKDSIVAALADQELGTLPGRAAGGAAAPPAAPPPAASPPPPPADSERGRYAQNQTTNAPAEEAPAAVNAAPEPQMYAQNQPGPRKVATQNDGDSSGVSLLQTAQEELRQGRCADANSALARLEQSFPGTPGLAETRAQWLRNCQMNQQLNQQLNSNQQMQPAAQMPQPAPTPSVVKPSMQQNYEQNEMSTRSTQMSNKAQAYRSAKKAAPPAPAPAKARPAAADKAALY